MSHESWLIVFVAVTAVAFLTQAVAVFLIATRVRDVSQRVTDASDQMRKRVDVLLLGANDLVRSLKPLAVLAQSIGANVGAISATARDTSAEISQVALQATETVRSQLAKLDFVVTDTAEKFEKTTAILQRDVLMPVVEISSIIRGIREGVEFLMSRKGQLGEKRSADDEEMFI